MPQVPELVNINAMQGYAGMTPAAYNPADVPISPGCLVANLNSPAAAAPKLDLEHGPGRLPRSAATCL